MNHNQKNDIAIIGMAGNFPDAQNVDELFANLKSGKNSIRNISKKRMKDTELSPDAPYAAGGFLEDIDKFDNVLFGISRTEAKAMDPAQRLLLQTAYVALESTGYGISFFSGTRTAVFISETNSGYKNLFVDNDPLTPVQIVGNSSSFLASRISRQFNLKGISLVINTACSSSLVALTQACSELVQRRADYAIVAGANINAIPTADHLSALGLESADSESRSFSDRTKGMIMGEAVAGVVLKRLDDAIKDSDNIQAVITGWATNNNAGESASITAPDSRIQAELLDEAWHDSGITPMDIGFIEAHGSGTILGDCLEIEGLNEAFKKYTDKKKICPISTVKSNIGHGMSVAGLCGLIKTVLSLRNKIIFEAIRCDKINPFIDEEKSAVYVNKVPRKWSVKKGEIRYAGVTSLGLSGTNCHVVLKEYLDNAGNDKKYKKIPPPYNFKKIHFWEENLSEKKPSDDTFEKNFISEKEGDEIERVIIEIWQGELQAQAVNLQDNFFKIGGDSLKATRVINRLNKYFDIRLDFEDIFDYPTVSLLAVHIDGLLSIERKIALMWKKILQVEDVKADDNFFQLGGHSLLATQVIGKIKNEFGYLLNFNDIYDHPTPSSLADHIRNKKVKNLSENSGYVGGVPLTAIGEYIYRNRSKQDLDRERPVIKCRNIDRDMLMSSISEASNLKDGGKLSVSIQEGGAWDSKKELKIPRSQEIEVIISGKNNNFELAFLKNPKIIKSTTFLEFLRNIQNTYNAYLIGEKCGTVSRSKKNQFKLMPEYSYPYYYSCFDACVIDSIRRRYEGYCPISLLAAMNLACLPNLCITKKNELRNNDYNSGLLGYSDALHSLDIRYKISNFDEEAEAIKFYNYRAKIGQPVILIGSSYFYPTPYTYKNKLLIEAELENRTMPGRRGRVPAILNVSFFSGNIDSGPVCYSPNLNFYGKISADDFINYWKGPKFFEALKGVKKYQKVAPYQMMEIQSIGKIRSNHSGLLLRSLKMNVDEFYKDRTIVGQEKDGYKKIFFGSQVIKRYIGYINEKRKDRMFSDIYIIDFIKRLEKPYLFLRDLLVDLNLSKSGSNIKLDDICSIIDKLENIFRLMAERVNCGKIIYRYNIVMLPPENLCGRRYLTYNDKKKLIKEMEEIEALQDRLFFSLKKALKQKL